MARQVACQLVLVDKGEGSACGLSQSHLTSSQGTHTRPAARALLSTKEKLPVPKRQSQSDKSGGYA